jgi:preprotein translocase subunit SecD
MNKSKLFVGIIFIVSLWLLLFNLPKVVVESAKTSKLPGLNQSIDLQKVVQTVIPNFSFGPFRIGNEQDYRLGLDLQGGVRLVYSLDMADIKREDRESAFESTRNIIERRVNFFGATEPNIQTLRSAGDYRVIIELPGVTDVDQATNLIGKTAQLTFWEQGTKEATASGKPLESYPFGLLQVFSGFEPIKTNLTGKDLENAQVVFDQNNGEPSVQLNFSGAGTKLFGDITKRNVNKPLAIVLDNELIQAPVVRQPILNGDANISGGFTTESAKNLQIALNSGALPVPLNLIAQSNVGPSLGIESLKKSLFAGLIGFLSIVIFMIYNYRKEGILASVALIVYSIIVLFLFKSLSMTLTLAGIAGFILSIGMAVDANVLIFERMKEERRLGRKQDVAIEVGFRRAWSSIRDSNISSLITCVILIYFGSGIVRGFAVTLAIGILVSMFTAITVTRNLLRVFDAKEHNKKGVTV